jgi:hypothetical protein
MGPMDQTGDRNANGSAALVRLNLNVRNVILTRLSEKDARHADPGQGSGVHSQHVRERSGLMPGTDVSFEIADGVVRPIKTAQAAPRKTRGQTLVDRLRGAGDFGMSTDEVIALMRGQAADEA